MTHTFFFYDLETSGLNPREDRIMQFAGQRTDMNLQPIGDPYNILVQLSDDTLPSPDALMVTGITPQSTRQDGISEAEFARLISDEICKSDTIIVGFNNIRFDDEFMRALLWRNFHDPYEWCWKNGCSRWDMLDVVRMTRALRPEGIVWPEVDGVATNRLELLTKENGLQHEKAHDALSDVEALIDITRLIKTKQPKLYSYLLANKDKKKVKELVNLDEKKPFVYTSGRYDSQYHKTTIGFPLTSGSNSNVVVYDLRFDPTPFLHLTSSELAERLFASWQETKADDFVKIPVKELQYNRCPAVAPLGVLEQNDGWSRINLTLEIIEKNKMILLQNSAFAENIRSVYENKPTFPKTSEPEAQLYDSFVGDRDKLRIETVRNAHPRKIADFQPEFQDERLSPLLLHYKARNFPASLTETEAKEWENWRAKRIQRQIPAFTESLQKIAATEAGQKQQFLLEELQLWAQNVMPVDTSNDE